MFRLLLSVFRFILSRANVKELVFENLALRQQLAVMKRQVYEHLMASLGPAEREARRLMGESFRGPDFKEGVSSFLEKRPPRFGRLGRG